MADVLFVLAAAYQTCLMRACVPRLLNGLYQLFDPCLMKHVLTVWPLFSTLACLVTKQCLMVFRCQTFLVCPGRYWSNMIQQDQTRCPNGKMSNRVWSPNIPCLEKASMHGYGTVVFYSRKWDQSAFRLLRKIVSSWMARLPTTEAIYAQSNSEVQCSYAAWNPTSVRYLSRPSG